MQEIVLEAGRAELARRGLYAELTAAIVWEALKHVPGDTVAILTGSGLKNARSRSAASPSITPPIGR